MAQFDPPEALLADLAARWTLSIGPPLVHEGVAGWVARARRGDDRYVLKLVEQHVESRDEAAGLRAWDGRGTIRLLEELTVGTATAMLLEECVPGTSLASRSAEEQDAVLAGLLRRLWIDPPADGPFRPLADMCAWWADEADAKGVPMELAEGLALFRTLPVDSPRRVLLATDLHAGNILAAEREPWLVIDPKPYVGDPTFDALQHMLNHPDRLQADAGAFCDRMAGLLDLDRGRLRHWLFARCAQESPGHPELGEVARQLAP